MSVAIKFPSTLETTKPFKNSASTGVLNGELGTSCKYKGSELLSVRVMYRAPNSDEDTNLSNNENSRLPTFVSEFRNGVLADLSDCNDRVQTRVAKSNDISKEIRNEIYSFKEYKDGWDGSDSKGPTSDAISDALNYLTQWGENFEILEPELTFDGIVVLQIYDQEGYTNGGIKFVGNGVAYYTIVNRTKDVASKYFNPKSNKEIFDSIEIIKSELKKIRQD